jgi:hypothetical protein
MASDSHEDRRLTLDEYMQRFSEKEQKAKLRHRSRVMFWAEWLNMIGAKAHIEEDGEHKWL